MLLLLPPPLLLLLLTLPPPATPRRSRDNCSSTGLVDAAGIAVVGGPLLGADVGTAAARAEDANGDGAPAAGIPPPPAAALRRAAAAAAADALPPVTADVEAETPVTALDVVLGLSLILLLS